MTDPVKQVFRRVMGTHGLVGRGSTFVLERPETVLVVNLQRSNYSRRWYVNVGVWFTGLGPPPARLREELCHVQTRLGHGADEFRRLDELLDPEAVEQDEDALTELHVLLDGAVARAVRGTSDVRTFREAQGDRLMSDWLVMGPARAMLGLSVPRDG